MQGFWKGWRGRSGRGAAAAACVPAAAGAEPGSPQAPVGRGGDDRSGLLCLASSVPAIDARLIGQFGSHRRFGYGGAHSESSAPDRCGASAGCAGARLRELTLA